MLSKYDKIITGFAVAIIVAFVAYALLLQVQDFLSDWSGRPLSFNERSIALMALCFTVLPMNYFRRRYQNKSLRGLVIGTMALAAVWFFYYGRDLLNAG